MPLRPSPELASAADAVLAFLRHELGFDAALVTVKDDEACVALRADDPCFGFVEGAVLSWSSTLCAQAEAGRAPAVAPDLRAAPAHAEAATALGLDIGAFATFPLRDDDGALLGTVCGLSREPLDDGLHAAGRQLRLVSDLLGRVLRAEGRAQRATTPAAPDPAAHRAAPPTADQADEAEDEELTALLRMARRHVGLPVAAVVAAGPGRRILHRSAAGVAAVPGDDPLETASLHVPVVLADGSMFGWLACWGDGSSSRPLDVRDAAVLRSIAEVVAVRLASRLEAQRRLQAIATAVADVLDNGRIAMVFQPIVDLDTRRVVAREALARFRVEPARTPDRWFADADAVGMGPVLERDALARALEGLPFADGLVSVNMSAATVLADGFADALAGHPLERIVVELTEHEAVDDYAGLAAVLDPLRARGLRVAVDDVGTGYASMLHVVRLGPDYLKIDQQLVTGMADDPARHAMATALAGFAVRTGALAVAEGIETAADLRACQEAGITLGQGWHLGRPGPLAPTA